MADQGNTSRLGLNDDLTIGSGRTDHDLSGRRCLERNRSNRSSRDDNSFTRSMRLNNDFPIGGSSAENDRWNSFGTEYFSAK